MRALLVTALVSATASGAIAQTEAERRRLHVPYVRAATDCIARSIAANEAALGHAAAGRWGQAVNIIFEVCRPQMQSMIASHDQIYGGGGLEFFRGAYLNDLPRALTTRLKPDLDRRAARLAEQEQREREAAAQREQAARAQQQARRRAMQDGVKAYNDCLYKEVASIIPFSNERAEVLVTVAETKCRTDRERLINLAQAIYGAGPETRHHVDELLSDARNELVADIVTLRAAAEAGRQGPPRQSPQTVPAGPSRVF